MQEQGNLAQSGRGCAIYVRKSSNCGPSVQANSLEIQRQICERSVSAWPGANAVVLEEEIAEGESPEEDAGPDAP